MYWRSSRGFTPHHFSIEKSGAGFTLLELLVVMALLSVVSTVTVLVVNPAELLRQARDAERLDNFASIEKSIGLIQANNPSAPLGANNTVYVSLPSDQADCSDLGLPDLPQVPVMWSYACASSDNYRKTDGNGWLPINFENLSGTSLFATLPVDPVNVVPEGLYYTYVHQNPFKLTAVLESGKYKPLMVTDGGPDLSLYEVGSDLTLANFARGLVGYWKFDDGGGTSPIESSGYDPAYSSSFVGSPTWTTGILGGALDFDGTNRVDVFSGLPESSSDGVALSAWIKLNSALGGSYRRITNRNTYRLSLLVDEVHFQVWDCAFNGVGLLATNAPLTIGQWYHVLGQYDYNVGRGSIFIDGERVLSTIFPYDDDVCYLWNTNIGGTDATDGVDAVLDEVRIYNRALSDNEVQRLYELVTP
jgi:prepilin-type N-terminal cleavage/methylation domain-containing protein